jgi:VIT1/CCC1 family predicted Fe2+/Mn2+ transporter
MEANQGKAAEMLDEGIKNKLLTAQRNEITEHLIYERLSRLVRDPNNREVLKRISGEELGHYNTWRKYTKQDVKPSRFKLWKYFLISRILGLTFGIKLMEKGEEKAQVTYGDIAGFAPDAESIISDEEEHERQLVELIDEERLRYVGSMVLGLNDALVELTGALAGFTLALQNSRLIAMVGLITGIAASLSMAASEYLSTKTEGDARNPLKASVYTGCAYILTVLFLIFPYLILTNFYLALGFTILNAIIVILIFTFYISVARDASFRRSFSEMASISLGVAALTFGIGFVVRVFFDVDV